jgi:hypothetical protein
MERKKIAINARSCSSGRARAAIASTWTTRTEEHHERPRLRPGAATGPAGRPWSHHRRPGDGADAGVGLAADTPSGRRCRGRRSRGPGAGLDGARDLSHVDPGRVRSVGPDDHGERPERFLSAGGIRAGVLPGQPLRRGPVSSHFPPQPEGKDSLSAAVAERAARFPETTQRVIWGRVVQGEAWAEIAAATDLTPAAARMRWTRAKRALRAAAEAAMENAPEPARRHLRRRVARLKRDWEPRRGPRQLRLSSRRPPPSKTRMADLSRCRSPLVEFDSAACQNFTG